jgi:hypothetical protein
MSITKSATIIKVDGTTQELNHRPTLEEAQSIVGGYIGFVKLEHGILIVDEEGLLKNKPINMQASRLYGHSAIVGDVILLKGWRTVG